MNSLSAGAGGSSFRGDPHKYARSNPCTDRGLTTNIHGGNYTNVGNVSNSYNTIKVGQDEESLRIQAWLSPLEPYGRHQDVSNRRLDGVGDWVLQRNEFRSWHRGQEGSEDPTLLCCGGQGVGKTFIRYRIFSRNIKAC